jgi:hypothetical protein
LVLELDEGDELMMAADLRALIWVAAAGTLVLVVDVVVAGVDVVVG